MSPAAHTPGAEVSSAALQRTPPVSPSSSFAPRGEHDVGHRAGAHHHHVGLQHAAGAADDPLHPLAVALEALDAVGAHELDALAP